ncbi:MAG: XTP/dITP diphosphatase [Deltaproteobacteria bacterium]|nr:XTP/dITP diphosphatase [Deltaproteobacteria bacterium]
MKDILIATNNQGKIKEFLVILNSLDVRLLTLKEVGLILDVEENGDSYEKNAIIKATAAARLSRLVSIADDSGLEVDALGGAPGIYSARYAGTSATDKDRRMKMIEEIKSHQAPYPARFRCSIAIVTPDQTIKTFTGTCEGQIILEERGEHGFGYDPIFFLPEHSCTMAELSPEIKNQISHRARAISLAFDYIKSLIQK